MPNLRGGTLIVLYDAECGFCAVMLAALLTWDRAKRLDPVAIQSTRGEELLTGVERQARLESWHLVDRVGVVRSGGAAVTTVLAALPGGAPLAYAASQFPATTSRAYEWVACHRVLLGRVFKTRPRAWAARVVAEHAHSDQVST